MFGHQHYVPVLRIKPAELRTLRDLDESLRLVTTPILECPPRVLRGCDTASQFADPLPDVLEPLLLRTSHFFHFFHFSTSSTFGLYSPSFSDGRLVSRVAGS